MPDDIDSGGENLGDGRLQSLGKVSRILLFTQKDNHIDHRDFPDATAVIAAFQNLGRMIGTAPNAHMAFAGPLQLRHRLRHAGVRLHRPQRRLPQAQV